MTERKLNPDALNDLYEALADIWNALENEGPHGVEACQDIARAALAKARGESK